MPSKIFRLARVYVRGHCLNPSRVLDACQPAVHCFFNIWETIAALQCIAAMTNRTGYLNQFRTYLAFCSRQVVSIYICCISIILSFLVSRRARVSDIRAQLYINVYHFIPYYLNNVNVFFACALASLRLVASRCLRLCTQ